VDGQPRYLRMVLPRWAVAERARQRRPVAARPREPGEPVPPNEYHDWPDQELTDWLTKCVALGISKDRPPCGLESGKPVIARYTRVEFKLDGGQLHRIERDWSDFPAPAPTIVWTSWASSGTTTTGSW
jgi:hypothetical protein